MNVSNPPGGLPLGSGLSEVGQPPAPGPVAPSGQAAGAAVPALAASVTGQAVSVQEGLKSTFETVRKLEKDVNALSASVQNARRNLPTAEAREKDSSSRVGELRSALKGIQDANVVLEAMKAKIQQLNPGSPRLLESVNIQLYRNNVLERRCTDILQTEMQHMGVETLQILEKQWLFTATVQGENLNVPPERFNELLANIHKQSPETSAAILIKIKMALVKEKDDLLKEHPNPLNRELKIKLQRIEASLIAIEHQAELLFAAEIKGASEETKAVFSHLQKLAGKDNKMPAVYKLAVLENRKAPRNHDESVAAAQGAFEIAKSNYSEAQDVYIDHHFMPYYLELAQTAEAAFIQAKAELHEALDAQFMASQTPALLEEFNGWLDAAKTKATTEQSTKSTTPSLAEAITYTVKWRLANLQHQLRTNKKREEGELKGRASSPPSPLTKPLPIPGLGGSTSL